MFRPCPALTVFEAVGVGQRVSATAHPSLFGFFLPSPLHVRLVSFPAFEALGVGHKPDSFPPVGRTNRGSWEAVPFRIEPEAGQVCEYSSEKPSRIGSEESGDVLNHRPSGFNLAKQTGELRPEVAVILPGFSFSGLGVGLAGDSAAQEINSSNSVLGQSVGCDGVNVVILDYLRPMFRPHGTGEGVDVAHSDGFSEFGKVEAQAHAPDPRANFK